CEHRVVGSFASDTDEIESCRTMRLVDWAGETAFAQSRLRQGCTRAGCAYENCIGTGGNELQCLPRNGGVRTRIALIGNHLEAILRADGLELVDPQIAIGVR